MTLLALPAACGGGGDDNTTVACGPGGACATGFQCNSQNRCERIPDTRVTDFVSDLRAGGEGTVARQTGALPGAGSGASPTVTTSGRVINGGTVQVTIEAAQPFVRVVIGVKDKADYYVVTLPAAATSVDLFLTLAQAIATDTIEFVYAVGSASAVGAYEEVMATVVEVGTGELQVSISWDVDSDVDLHVIDPAGDEIYYGQTSSPSGGVLDLDSNAACSIDGVRNENITWTTAPRGTYKVRVDYYESCGVPASNYVVTVQKKGQAAQTFRGQLTGDGDQGDVGAGMDVTTFTMP
jgi:hypothetical protein